MLMSQSSPSEFESDPDPDPDSDPDSDPIAGNLQSTLESNPTISSLSLSLSRFTSLHKQLSCPSTARPNRRLSNSITTTPASDSHSHSHSDSHCLRSTTTCLATHIHSTTRLARSTSHPAKRSDLPTNLNLHQPHTLPNERRAQVNLGVITWTMRLFSEDLAERIHLGRRTASSYRHPRRSIYDPPAEPATKPRPPWPPARHGRTPSRISDHTGSCPSAPPSGSSDTTVATLPPERSRTAASADDCRTPHSAYATLGRATPRPGPRAASAMSAISFRSLRSMNSRIKVRMQSFGQALESRKPRPELDWSSLRAEYELHLARGSIIERCLVEVDLGPEVTERGRWWIDTVWTLADRLSPPLPALLAQYSAAGLLPLLFPLRHTLHSLALQLPYDSSQEADSRMERFVELTATLRRALWYAGLVEAVIEIVSRVGLVKFELLGLGPVDEAEADQATEAEETAKVAAWTGEIRGRTGSGDHWRGVIKNKP